MSLQMNAEFQKDQNGTLFVWVGALGDVYWGGGGPGPPNQKKGLTSITFFLRLLITKNFLAQSIPRQGSLSLAGKVRHPIYPPLVIRRIHIIRCIVLNAYFTVLNKLGRIV